MTIAMISAKPPTMFRLLALALIIGSIAGLILAAFVVAVI